MNALIKEINAKGTKVLQTSDEEVERLQKKC